MRRNFYDRYIFNKILLEFLNKEETYPSMLQDEAHLILVLSLGQDLSGIGNSSNLCSDFFISFFNLGPSILNGFINFLLDDVELGVLFLNLKKIFQLVNFWNLTNNILALCRNFLKHIHVQLLGIVFLKHVIDSDLDC